MAPTRGRLEGRITVPTGGWTATVGGGTATIAAGTYYPTPFLTTVATAFASAASTTCTVTASLGESGTGLVTIAFGSSKAITWVSTDLRDLLGFASDSSAATSHVGTKQMRNTWLPNCPYKAPNSIGAWRGLRESDFRAAENAAGYVFAHMGQSKEVTNLSWFAVTRNRIHEANVATANASFERFVRDAAWGEAAWGTAGGPIRFYPDADDSTGYVVYRVPDAQNLLSELQPLHDGWAGGPWSVRFPRLVADPTDTSGAPRSTITVTNLETSSSTVDGTTFTTGSISVGANELVLLACTGARLSSAVVQAPTSVAGSGLTFTKIDQSDFSAVIQARDLSVWRAMPSASFSGTITITYASSHSACVWSVVKFTGINTSGTGGSGAIVQSKNTLAADPSTSISTTLTSAIEHSKNVTFVAVGAGTNSTFSTGGVYTKIAQDTETSAPAGLLTEYQANTTTAAASISTSGTALGLVAVEIKAATT